MSRSLYVVFAAALLGACGGNPSPSSSSSIGFSSSASSSSAGGPVSCTDGQNTSAPANNDPIRINQFRFLPQSHKAVVVVNPSKTTFTLVRASDNKAVFCGTYSAAKTWAPSQETVRIADFSSYSQPGEYYVLDSGVRQSYKFRIGDDVFEDVHMAAIKAYYFNRASTALDSQYAGQWQRPAGHPDTQVRVHASAASGNRPAGTIISAPKGWYDAGDYNKYIVNSGISTYTLMAAYEQFKDLYNTVSVNIPESFDNVPDILNEVMWNLDWMEAMQDNDGGVYHKLTTLNFAGSVMPHNATATRYVVQKTTAATLNFAAVMAAASRVYSEFEGAFPGKSARYRQKALAAWQWAKSNSNIAYNQPSDVQTGTYGDSIFTDEFAWAAAELFLLTGDNGYLSEFKNNAGDVIAPWWGGVQTLGYISLLEHGEQRLSTGDYGQFRNAVLTAANAYVSRQKASAYGVAMEMDDFVWGSNSGALNQALVLITAYRATNNNDYLDAATAQLDYVLGRNATGYSFVTGQGQKTPKAPHHRQSEADGIADPVPGFIVGGPHAGQQDKQYCDKYTTNIPAKSYVDDACSYATNEVTINWNAPLVYVLGALQSL